jgi:hypothetical protein
MDFVIRQSLFYPPAVSILHSARAASLAASDVVLWLWTPSCWQNDHMLLTERALEEDADHDSAHMRRKRCLVK